MKRFFLIIVLSIFGYSANSQSFELLNGDTINKTDVANKRQGYWIVKDKSGKIEEEGKYADGRKVGLWKAYFDNGKLKSEITYVGSRPKGPYKLYFENGVLQEEGTWASTKNTGSFKRYHTNGNIAQDFNFTASGKREGVQKYFHENGQLQIEGTWAAGQESGELKEYYDNGDLKSVKVFAGGLIDRENYAEYAPKKPMTDPLKKQLDAAPNVNVKASKEEQPNQGGFTGNGYYKLYNKDMQIAKDGEFKDYRFINGKMYDYDQNGLLVKIKIFKNGRYIGDGVIEDK